jgi:hypothetical protein
MKKFVVNSALCLFFILSERLLDTLGEFIFSINNITYHVFSIILILGAVISFSRAVNVLTIIKSFVPEGLKKELK